MIQKIIEDENGSSVPIAREDNQFIMEMIVPYGKDQEGQTPLHRAVAWGNTHAVEILLDEGADINARDGEGDTPMEKALRGNITAVAILLGDRGALKKDGNPATEILPLKW